MIKVHLRKKPISDGRTSLYLDYYPAISHPDTGKPTRREFLGLYVFNRPKTPAGKDQNTETLTLAENIRAKRHPGCRLGPGSIRINPSASGWVYVSRGKVRPS